MRKCIYITVLCLVWITVSAAPTDKVITDIRSDELEQELIRHHHSTRTKGAYESDDNTYSDEKGNLKDESSPVESIEDIQERPEQQPEPETYDEDDLYDITVGDVIRDVLLTLHDHPEIVKELIENEKDKIATRLAEDAVDTIGADLSEYQEPAEQLQNKPKRVQKKDGKSGQVRTLAVNRLVNGYHGNDAEFNGYMNHKRTNEVLDEEFSPQDQSADSSEQFDGFADYVKLPPEGDNAYKIMYGGTSQEETDDSGYRRHFADSSSESDATVDLKDKYRLPMIKPYAVFKNLKNSGSSHSSSQSSDVTDTSEQKVKDKQTGSDVSETESNTTEDESSSESSEEQLSGLLRQMKANKMKENSQKNM